jgi:hypothetical protein
MAVPSWVTTSRTLLTPRARAPAISACRKSSPPNFSKTLASWVPSISHARFPVLANRAHAPRPGRNCLMPKRTGIGSGHSTVWRTDACFF